MVKSLIRLHAVGLVCLQEAKLQWMSVQMVRRLGVCRCLDWEAVDSRGQAGDIWFSGIAVRWSSSKWKWELIRFPFVSKTVRQFCLDILRSLRSSSEGGEREFLDRIKRYQRSLA